MFISATLVSTVAAESRIVKVEDASFNVESTLPANLKSFHNKTVTVHMKSGQNITGTVKSLGNRFVHIEKLNGREYFDALVRISEIDAVSARFREYKR